jgi:hypothetical protein
MTLRKYLVLSLLCVAAACSETKEENPLARCDDPAAGESDLFLNSEEGSGNFGLWQIGPYGLPEYRYTLRQETDSRADWPNTEQKVRRDHWHLVGNLRLNALAYNEGYVEVYTQERGNELLNRVDEATKNFGGGYSIVKSEAGIWSTAYQWRPNQTRSERAFGMGYVRYSTCDGGLRVTHTIWAPEGDHRFLVDDVTIENLTGMAQAVDHYEVWDVNRHYLAQQEVRSGSLNPKLPAAMDEERVKLNAPLKTGAKVEAAYARITNRLPGAGPDVKPAEPADVNDFPPDVFLMALDDAQDRFITDGAAFWGEGSPKKPGNLNAGELTPSSGTTQPGALIAERKLDLPAKGAIKLRYAFGALEQDAELPDLSAFHLTKTPEAAAANAKAMTSSLVLFDAPQSAIPEGEISADTLKREMAWHAYYLRNSGGYQDYFEHFVVNQGSAYWYKHGLDGAVRDFVFSAVALVYIDPALARETLLYAARMRFEANHALAYTVGSLGQISAAVIHDKPSDLDLFWWWGLAEYVFATGDQAILTELEPLWPKHESSERPIAEHIRLGARYLMDEIGTGANGLIKLGSGDWDDSITFFAPDSATAKNEGESVANAAMAAFIAPWAAALVEDSYPAAATELADLGAAQRTAVAAQWTGKWYRRAWFGAGEPFGDDVIFLFSSALALIAEAPTAAQGATLLKNIGTYLEEKSTTSLYQFWYLNPPSKTIEGVTDPGASNPIISALGVWGFANYDSERAWKAFLRNTMAKKAEVYPDIWYGIWSGSDSHYTNIHEQAGQTWASVATPQKDFPIMNSNAHNGPLLGLFRIMGLSPTVRMIDGKRVGALKVAPKAVAGHEYRLETPLLTLELGDGTYAMSYRPVVDGTVHFVFGLPANAEQIGAVEVDGVKQSIGAKEAYVSVDVKKGKPVEFRVLGGAAHF